MSIIAIDNVSALTLQIKVTHFGFPEGIQQLSLHRHLHHVGYVTSALVIQSKLVGGALALLIR